jgi:hypothetical protein
VDSSPPGIPSQARLGKPGAAELRRRHGYRTRQIRNDETHVRSGIGEKPVVRSAKQASTPPSAGFENQFEGRGKLAPDDEFLAKIIVAGFGAFGQSN